MKRIIYIFLLTIALVSCAPSPKQQAEAYAIEEAARQDAANQELLRQQQEDRHIIEMQQAEEDRETWNAVKETIRYYLNIFYQFLLIMLTASMCYILFYTSRITISTMKGFAAAAVRKAEVTANLIYLDDKGQFPALLEYVGKGVYSLTDLNTRTTMMLNTNNEPDRRMVAGAIAIRHTAVLSANAAGAKKGNSEDAANVIRPPVILDQNGEAYNE